MITNGAEIVLRGFHPAIGQLQLVYSQLPITAHLDHLHPGFFAIGCPVASLRSPQVILLDVINFRHSIHLGGIDISTDFNSLFIDCETYLGIQKVFEMTTRVQRSRCVSSIQSWVTIRICTTSYKSSSGSSAFWLFTTSCSIVYLSYILAVYNQLLNSILGIICGYDT